MGKTVTWEEVKERARVLSIETAELARIAKENREEWLEYLESDSHKEFLELYEKLCGDSAESVNNGEKEVNRTSIIQRVSITILAIIEVLSVLLVVKHYALPIVDTNIGLGVAVMFLIVTQIRLREYHRFLEMLYKIAEPRKNQGERQK